MVLTIQTTPGHQSAIKKRHELQQKTTQLKLKKRITEVEQLRIQYAARIVRGDAGGATALIDRFFDRDAAVLSSKEFLVAFHQQLMELAREFEVLAPDLYRLPLDDHSSPLLAGLQGLLLKYQDCAEHHWRDNLIWSKPGGPKDNLSEQWLLHTQNILKICEKMLAYWRGKFFIEGDKNSSLRTDLSETQKNNYYSQLMYHHDIQLHTYIDYMKHRPLTADQHAQLQSSILDTLQLSFRRYGERALMRFTKLYIKVIEDGTAGERSVDYARRASMLRAFTTYTSVINGLLETWQPFHIAEPVEETQSYKRVAEVWAEVADKLSKPDGTLRDLNWPIYLQVMKREVDLLQALVGKGNQFKVLQSAITASTMRCGLLIHLAEAQDSSHLSYLQGYQAEIQLIKTEVEKKQVSDQNFQDMLASLQDVSSADAAPSRAIESKFESEPESESESESESDSKSASNIEDLDSNPQQLSETAPSGELKPVALDEDPASYWYHCSSIAFKRGDLSTTRAYLLKALPPALEGGNIVLRVNIAIDLTEIEQRKGDSHIKRKAFVRGVQAYEHALYYCQIALKEKQYLSENNYTALTIEVTLLSRQLELHQQNVKNLMAEHEAYKQRAIENGTWTRPSKSKGISQPSLIYKDLKTHNVAPRLAQLQAQADTLHQRYPESKLKAQP